MEENTVTTIDLINHAMENNPTKLGDAFNSLVMSKVVDAVSAKKSELQQSMFGEDQPEEESEVVDQEQSEVETEDQETEQQEDDEVTDEEDTEPDA